MNQSPSRPEFVVLIALMISLVAMTTDVMLPALGLIALDLGQTEASDGHFVISVLFAGFALGQLLVGPLADSFGRRPVIHGSYVLFLFGTLCCVLAQDFSMLLLGRFLQGLGMAGPRIVAVAIVRDGYEGRAMARIMSFVMAVFIIVPAVAPAIGQVLILWSGWRATFVLLLCMALITWLWFALRQHETLAAANRRPFSIRSIAQGIGFIFRTPAAIGYTLAVGVIFGPFLAYLSLAQQIFQELFDIGTAFAGWFAVGALSIGAASVVNSALVERLGMRFLSNVALVGVVGVAIGFALYDVMTPGTPAFALFMAWLVVTFFCMGLLFGNLNALAMEPLGKMAGLGAAVVGALSTLIALPIGYLISETFNGSLLPLVLGFGGVAALALALGSWASIAKR